MYMGMKENWVLHPKTRKCPKCNKEIHYSKKRYYKRACEKNSYCNRCANTTHFLDDKTKLVKNCMSCGGEVLYKTKQYFLTSNRIVKCISCRNRELLHKHFADVEKYYNKTLDYFEYNCPECNVTMVYKNRKRLRECIRKKNICNVCRIKNLNKKSEEIKRVKKAFKDVELDLNRKLKNNYFNSIHEIQRVCIICKKIIPLKNPKKKTSNYKCKSCLTKNKWEDIDYRNRMCDKISESMKLAWKDVDIRKKLTDCQNRDGVRFSKKEKMTLRMIGKTGKPNYNTNACGFIDLLNDVYGWDLQHALNGKEVCVGGYFPDGYDKDRNIIFEYDESHHYYANGELKPEDRDRQNDMMKYFEMKNITPRFIRYDLKRNKLYLVI